MYEYGTLTMSIPDGNCDTRHVVFLKSLGFQRHWEDDINHLLARMTLDCHQRHNGNGGSVGVCRGCIMIVTKVSEVNMSIFEGLIKCNLACDRFALCNGIIVVIIAEVPVRSRSI